MKNKLLGKKKKNFWHKEGRAWIFISYHRTIYTYSMYTNSYVALISKAHGQCGLKASWQPQTNLDTQIKFLILIHGEFQRAKLQNWVGYKVCSLVWDNQPKRHRPKHLFCLFLQKMLNLNASTQSTVMLSSGSSSHFDKLCK